MQVFLRIIGGKNDGREVRVAVPEYIIGRGEEAHLKPSSDLVSRKHCLIKIGNGKVQISDMGSRNGTFVNGEQLKSVHIAKPGDRVRVGRLQFEMVIDVAKPSAKKDKVKDAVDAAARTVEAAKPASLEDSISDWLSVEDESSPFDDKEIEEVAMTETIQLSAEETQQFLEKVNEEDAAKAADIAAADRKENKGKLPPRPSDSHVDSTDAAGDVLKKFFNRR